MRIAIRRIRPLVRAAAQRQAGFFTLPGFHRKNGMRLEPATSEAVEEYEKEKAKEVRQGRIAQLRRKLMAKQRARRRIRKG